MLSALKKVIYVIAPQYWTYYTSKTTKKLKKANEGQKGQIKGQTQVNIIFSYFFGMNVFTRRI